VAMRLIFDVINGVYPSVPKTLPDFLVPSSKAHLVAANQAITSGLKFERPDYDDDDTPVHPSLLSADGQRVFRVISIGTSPQRTNATTNTYTPQTITVMDKSRPHPSQSFTPLSMFQILISIAHGTSSTPSTQTTSAKMPQCIFSTS
jgi:Cytoskeletal-regulatory complex EF hand